MMAKAEDQQLTTAHKVEHQIFKADEELESDAMLAELSGTDANAARLVTMESHLPQSADRMAVTFGTLNSI